MKDNTELEVFESIADDINDIFRAFQKGWNLEEKSLYSDNGVLGD